jgi:hypothetical protein
MALKFFRVTVQGQPIKNQSIFVHGESNEEVLSRVKIEEVKLPNVVKTKTIVAKAAQKRHTK